MIINQLQKDKNGNYSGILAIDKPKWMTSHDVVDVVRKKLKMRKVGHSGTLDPFATGLLLILVGKSTKLSSEFLNSQKEYRAQILFGITTDSFDVEGNILEVENLKDLDIDIKTIKNKLKKIQSGYMQKVPVFSSVKVDGVKLRVLARKAEDIKIEGENVKFVFENKETKIIKLPSKKVTFTKFDLKNLRKISYNDLDFHFKEKIKKGFLDFYKKFVNYQFVTCDLVARVSKGTYIRQLAFDIGEILDIPAMLIDLRRTAIADFDLDHAMSLDDFFSKITIDDRLVEKEIPDKSL